MLTRFTTLFGAEGATVDLLEVLLQAVNLDNVNLSRRKRRQANNNSQASQELIDVIQNYGCWCPKFVAGTAYQGKPLDYLDTLCRYWSSCTYSALEIFGFGLKMNNN